jgi:serine kinase of HPr protein (carbohydrate metabolism regulator)
MVANIHASCVRLEDAAVPFGAPRAAGVLLLGRSGSGKSDLALRLIQAGARLVSDDRTELFVENKHLFARAPAGIKGLLEVRGAGIVALPAAAKARVALAVTLERPKSRLPEPEFCTPAPGLPVRIHLIRLAAFEASTPAKIVLAVAAFERGFFCDSAHTT